MPAIAHPGFEHDYHVELETRRIRSHQLHRGIPERKPNNLLIASWNFANLGDPKQGRSLSDLMLMAEILRPFDLIGVQEIKDDFRQFRELLHLLGPDFDYLITDRAGNDERLGFIYDVRRVERMQLAAELVILPNRRPTLKIKQRTKTYNVKFSGFNRNPYLSAFRSGQFVFTLANVHIYYGATSGPKFRRRASEVYTLAKWAHERVTSKAPKTFDHDIILIGDFNIPKLSSRNRIARQLVNYGMQPTTYSSYMGTNLEGHRQYDQIAFHPGHTQNKFTGNAGVFDFDKVLFPELWERYSKEEFNQFVRYHVSDHRLLWTEWNNTTP
jgi:hypothetical protein